MLSWCFWRVELAFLSACRLLSYDDDDDFVVDEFQVNPFKGWFGSLWVELALEFESLVGTLLPAFKNFAGPSRPVRGLSRHWQARAGLYPV